MSRAKQAAGKAGNAARSAAYHSKYAKQYHELLGFGAFAGAIVLLLLDVLFGSTTLKLAVFNISLLLLAGIFPVHRHGIFDEKWENYYQYGIGFFAVFSFLLFLVQGETFWTALLNPGTLNLVFGLLFVHSMFSLQYATTTTERITTGFLFIIMLSLLISLMPWSQVPAGNVRQAGLAAKSVIDPIGQTFYNTGVYTWECTIGGMISGGSNCQDAAVKMESTLTKLFKVLPPPVAKALSYVAARAMGYIGGMSCIGSHGGLFGIAYDNPALSGGYDPNNASQVPYQNVEDCFTGNRTTSGSGTGGSGSGGSTSNGISMKSVKIDGSTATVTFTGTYPKKVSATDFTVTAGGSNLVTGASGSGDTVTLTIDSSGLNIGDGVSVSAAVDGTCNDQYGDGKTALCP